MHQRPHGARRHFATRLAARLAIHTAAIGVALLAASGAQAAKISMESASGNSTVGMMPQAMASHWAAAGVDVELALDQTLTKSLLKLGQGSLDASVIPHPAYLFLRSGTGPYAKMGDKAKALAGNVRALYAFTASTLHPIVWADSGIEKWEDVKGKRIFIGPPAGAANSMIKGLIKTASGLEEPKDYSAIKAPWGAAGDAFKDGQYDVYVGAYGLGSQALAELSLTRNIRVLSMPNTDEPPEALGVAVGKIPAKTYPGLVNDKDSIAWRTLMMLATGKDLPDDVAYKLTKTYFESIDKLKAGNAALNVLDAEDAFLGLRMPLHPGAVKYYKEKGVKIPDALLPK